MQQYFQISKSLQGLQRFVGFNGLLYLESFICSIPSDLSGAFLVGNVTRSYKL